MRIIGVMSGTSLDGIDIACVDFFEDHQFIMMDAKTYPYSKKWKQTLVNAIHLNKKELALLNIEYGSFLSETIQSFINEFNLQNIDLIASHGHTIFHQPDKGFTLQIGDGQTIANKTNLKVICDFRTQDVELGGQGAPLVPIGDELLFQEYRYCLNLGGFANISYQQNSNRIAFDICPVNTVLNLYAQKLGFPYDDGGNLAKKGKVDEKLLKELNHLPFYQQLPPKSLGIEWVHQFVIPILEASKISPQNILATFTQHIAIQISKILQEKAKVLVTGGGVFNSFLINQLQDLSVAEIHIPDQKLINFKEALIFAFLGYLKHQNIVNCLSSVTGASTNHSSGKIFYPQVL